MIEKRLTKDLGELRGRLLLFGGPYSNFQALSALRAMAEREGIPPHNCICTGDVVGYCAQPAECIALMQEWGAHCIAGNVEEQMRAGADNCGCDFREGGRCDLFSQQWYAYAQRAMNESGIRWMDGLPRMLTFRYAMKSFAVVHGSFFETAEYIFHSTPWARKEASLRAVDADVVIAGHSGLPFIESSGSRTWINAGAIGMPANDGDARVWFAIVDSEEGRPHARLCRLAYDHNHAAALMREKGLPDAYARTLLTGIWDNCEILPAAEAAAQGEVLDMVSRVYSL